MPGQTWQVPLSSPASIAIHNDGKVAYGTCYLLRGDRFRLHMPFSLRGKKVLYLGQGLDLQNFVFLGFTDFVHLIDVLVSELL